MLETYARCNSRVLFNNDTCPACGISKTSAAEISTSSSSDKDRYHKIIFGGLWDNRDDSSIVAELVKAGCPEDVARLSLADERRKRRVQAQAQARGLIKGGAIIAAIGIFITASTYLSATRTPEGGTYLVAWGAIVAGIVQMIRGSLMSSK